ncbi:TPA: hypothetical protein ROS75_002103 [Yersinia enterocolitica]|nr:hypothetical protein [Yersinia enterocolitica]HEN3546473.1 hypothetical protein [Yersinia enterocolitica]
MALTLLSANNASTVLSAGISASATTLTVNTGTGGLFPSPVSGTSFFKLTLIDAATGTLTEIVHVTARTGDTMTIVRGQEGTVSRLWSANDIAANMMTAGTLDLFAQSGSLGGAAQLNVGTTAGTVAAGNDSRINGALQKTSNLSDLQSVSSALTNLGLGDVIRKSDTNVQLPGQLTTKGNIKSTEGDLYSGDARLAHDGNIFGTVWGDSLFHYLEGKLPKVTTVYINAGTPESPYQYPVRSRQTFGNPFPGRIIECKAELFINNIWGPTGFIYSSDNSWGVTASPFDNSARIVVQSGRTGTAAISENAGGVHGISNNVNSPLPIRLKVWTVD